MLGGAGAFAGGAPGINAYLGTEPVPGFTIIVLSNYDPPTAMKAGKEIGHVLKRLR